MTVPDDRLASLATAVLAAIEARYTLSGLVLPERRYTHVGEVAYDCEQLVVTLALIYPGTPGAPIETAALKGGPFSATATLEAHLVRCVPLAQQRQTAPSAAAMNEAGQRFLTDTRETLRAITSHQDDFTPSCQLFVYTGSRIVGAEGGFVGIVTSLDVQL